MLRMFVYAAGFLLGFFFDAINEAAGTYLASVVILIGLVVTMAWDFMHDA